MLLAGAQSPHRWASHDENGFPWGGALVRPHGRARYSWALLDAGSRSHILRNMSNDRNTSLDRYAEIFRALGNPHRLAIFLRLVRCCAPEAACCEEGRECPCVGEFAQTLNLAPSTVSHHIKELHRCGLIRTERRGQTVRCWVAPETLADVARFFLGKAAQCPGLSDEQVQHIQGGWETGWPETS